MIIDLTQSEFTDLMNMHHMDQFSNEALNKIAEIIEVFSYHNLNKGVLTLTGSNITHKFFEMDREQVMHFFQVTSRELQTCQVTGEPIEPINYEVTIHKLSNGKFLIENHEVELIYHSYGA